MPRHGSPADRGSADAYYGRQKNPHYYKGNSGGSELVTVDMMTPNEIADYHEGYDNEDDRKSWR